MFGFFNLLRKQNTRIRLYTETEQGTRFLGEIQVTKPTSLRLLMDTDVLIMREEIDDEYAGSIGFSDAEAKRAEIEARQAARRKAGSGTNEHVAIGTAGLREVEPCGTMAEVSLDLAST